ncbi:MAG: 2-oxo acid dehydrogenase subunit E2 [Acidimicrobiia bacterium]|nr:2-oxo acid dehydrogenase subunit E2 [Acidimicrobiia bacterium]
MFGRRPDARLSKDVPHYRRMMPYIMRTRTESAVYFDQQVDVARTEDFLRDFGERHPDLHATFFHVVLWATVQVLHERPRLNRFTAGGRLWDRKHIEIGYSAKKRFDDASPIVVLKRRFDPTQSFVEMVRDLNSDVKVGKSDEKNHTDKELNILLRLPGPALKALLVVERRLDAWGLLPSFFTAPDPMFSSVFIANLGSLKMDSAFHHLYEYGNCPVFGVIGQVKEQPWAENGEVVVKRIVSLKWSYDERVEDGLYAQRALERLREIVEDPGVHPAIGTASLRPPPGLSLKSS